MKLSLSVLLSAALLWICPLHASDLPRSHAPLHEPVFSTDTTVPEKAYYVDSAKGADANAGNREQPWKTVQHAMTRLRPGDTLLLRGGVYFENVYCAVVGEKERPITIRSYPGEVAVLDGGIAAFQNDPAGSWEPGKAEGEYVSKQPFPNIRDVLGLFGDSLVGLQTYWHRDDLISTGETTTPGNATPFYCGPGLFYNKQTGRIHARLAHTRQPYEGFPNYTGETDPRKLPLVVAPFRSVPLFIDQAMYVRFQDLVIRGGGYNTVVMHFGVEVEFSYVTIYGGTYCLRSKNSGPVRMTNSALVGQIPPWGYWSDNALHTYDPVYYDPFTQPPEPRTPRNVARLPTHALLVTEGAEESDVFAYPYNNQWTISQCEFMDSHDGIYLNGRRMTLRHCLIQRVQDDSFYLSSPTPQAVVDDLHISHNYLVGGIGAFGAHMRGATQGYIYVYKNVVDQRHTTHFKRTEENLKRRFANGHIFSSHGRDKAQGMENIGFYYNTFLLSGRQFAGSTYAKAHAQTVREVFNNLFIYTEQLPQLVLRKTDGRVDLDGNLHWAPGHDPASPEQWLASIRDSEASQKNVSDWNGTPWAAHSRYGDPKFRDWQPGRLSGNDLRLSAGSAARGMAVPFANREQLLNAGPDAGALQGDENLRVGINLRVAAGE